MKVEVAAVALLKNISKLRQVAKGGAGGAAAPPICLRSKGNSDVITAMTSLLLKGGPMNVD